MTAARAGVLKQLSSILAASVGARARQADNSARKHAYTCAQKRPALINTRQQLTINE